MAVTVYDNLVDGDRRIRTLDGREITKKIIVDNIPLDLYGEQKNDYAIDNCGYSVGDIHPDRENAVLKRIESKSISPLSCELELTYIEMDTNFDITISSNTYQVETNIDYQGNLLEISYTYPDDYILDESLRGKTISKSPTVPKDMNEVIMTITTTKAITSDEIINLAIEYKDTLNLAGWSVRPLALQSTWKCNDISGVSNKDGTYDMTYVFSARKVIPISETNYISGFSFDLFYRDERTGEPPADVAVYTQLIAGVPDVAPGGIKKGQKLYPNKNFNNIISL